MANDSTALPWFPLTPDYIDKYNESVIKYLKDEASATKEDKSFSTTISLLHQRTEQLLAEFSSKPLDEAEIIGESLLLQYIRTVGSEVFMLMKKGEPAKDMLIFMSYLVALYDNELTDEMSALIFKAIRAEKVNSIAFGMNDIVNLDIHSMAKALQSTEFEVGTAPTWFERKGTLKLDSKGISIYDMNRSFIDVKLKTGGSFKTETVIDHIPVGFEIDKKDKKGLFNNRHLRGFLFNPLARS